MSNYFSLSLIFSLLGVISCNSETSNTNQAPKKLVITPPVDAAATSQVRSSSAWLADSIDHYCPTFGTTNTTLQVPFGSAKQSSSALRLHRVFYNGKLIRTYQYNGYGKLSKRTDYYTDGIHIRAFYTYNYESSGLVQTSIKLNKNISVVSGYPQTNDLVPSSIITYTPNTKHGAWLEKKVLTKSVQSNDQLSDTSYLGFDIYGNLVWEETADDTGQIIRYSLYKRDQTGNIVFYRKASQSYQWENYSFTYDEKPSPFYSTGDSQPNDLFGFTVTGPNNVTLQQSINAQRVRDTWQLKHAYRSDGYPYLTKIYREGELMSMFNYEYN